MLGIPMPGRSGTTSNEKAGFLVLFHSNCPEITCKYSAGFSSIAPAQNQEHAIASYVTDFALALSEKDKAAQGTSILCVVLFISVLLF